MSHAKMLCVVSTATLIALATTAAPAQSDAETPRRGRFLDILKVGKRVRIDESAPQGTDGIELTMASAAAWKEIAEGGEEVEKRIATLEAKRDELERQQNETISLLGNRRGRNGLDRVAVFELRQAVDKFQDEGRATYREILALRKKLPSNYQQITIVGADYFAVDKGNTLVCYPAGRIRQIKIIKKLPENEKAEKHQSEGATAKPPQKNPSRADHAKPKE